ncbi:MAG: penicillin-insensitive murein endopeptidase [Syntrophobacterales bacterium]|nr:penicillin-insensitive murein endopeptidase [Syntrophobacterales bacterium]
MNKRVNSKFLFGLMVGPILFSLWLVGWPLCPKLEAMTRSVGYPFEGRLENGIPFPREFRGYQLRSVEHTYTTPEVIGALLDAIENVRQDFPDTCDIYLGDFSRPGGGPWYPVHKSHQNGRDVDIGMYAKGNQPLNTLVPMNEENLDLPKNWSLILHLLNSHLVERIFVDISIQRLLYNYALSQGYDKSFLDKVFQAGSGEYEYTFVRHEPNHRDHMHIRFVAPWSELAGRIENPSPQQIRVIELAQSSFLPKKVLYYAKDEGTPEALSSKLGIPLEDIVRWNKLRRLDVIRPGMPIVFYKRGFDFESVQLALSLDAMLMRSRNGENLALLHNDVILNIPLTRNIIFQIRSEEDKKNEPSPQQLFGNVKPVNKAKPSFPPLFHVVKKGDTLESIAKKYNLSIKEVVTLNKISPKTTLKPGQRLIISKNNQRKSTPANLVALNRTFGDKLQQNSKNDKVTKAPKNVSVDGKSSSSAVKAKQVSNNKPSSKATNLSQQAKGKKMEVTRKSSPTTVITKAKQQDKSKVSPILKTSSVRKK